MYTNHITPVGNYVQLLRRVALVLFLLTASPLIFTAVAQQMPQYTQYIFNNYLLNPALSGIENYTELKAGYRQQWVGLEDAPVTSYLSVHTAIGKAYKFENVTSFSGGGSNPMSRSFVNEYQASQPHHGIGLHVVNDKAGFFHRTDFQATYSYHLGLAPKLNFAVGVAAGFTQMNLDKSKMRPEEISDNRLQTVSASQTSPLLSAGLWLYGSQFFLGLSGNQLLPNTSKSSGTSHILLVPHYNATMGYKLFVTDGIALLPSIMATAVASSYSVDCNAKIAFQDRFWLGGGLRKGDSFSAMTGFNINSFFNLSYSYDYSTSPLRSVSNGSHEIVLGLLLNNKYKVTCPQRQF